MEQKKQFPGQVLAAWLFIAIIGLWAALVVCLPSFGQTYDATLPADTSKVASFPLQARNNFEALRKNAIVNAGSVASYTPVQVMGEIFTCVASTTSVTMYNSSGTTLLLGSATGTHELLCLVSVTGFATASTLPFSGTYSFGVWVATTTEILGKIKKFKNFNDTRFDLSIATSSTRGEIIFNASGTAQGQTWTNRVHRSN